MQVSWIYFFIFLFYYLVMNISLRGMITDHLSDTYVPGTNGHTSIGFKTLTTPGAGFPVRDRLSFPFPVWVRLAHTVPVSFPISPCRGNIICVSLFTLSLLFTYKSFRVLVTLLQNITFCILIVRSSPSLFVLK